MSNAELIELARENFKNRGANPQSLHNLHLREAVAIYFQMKPRGNCMVILDKNTGEEISAMTSLVDALRPEYEPAIRLANESRALVAESKKGMHDRFPEGGTQPTVFREDLVNALQMRCPEWSKEDCDRAMTEAFAEADRAAERLVRPAP